jgi:GTP-binding protein HflX
LGIDTEGEEGPVLEVWNKADRLSEAERADAVRALRRHGGGRAVLLSARTGEGIDALLAVIDRRLGVQDEIVTVDVPAGHGRLLSWLHAHAEVLEEATADCGTTTARIRITPANRGKLAGQLKRAGLPGH